MTSKAKFFCENCNNEVRSDAMVCPHCGRFFAAVRCPSCKHTGINRDFLNGCPECGYAVFPKPKIVMRKKADRSLPYPQQKQKKTAYADTVDSEGSLPLWIYAAVFLLAGAAAVAFTIFVL